jgi:hypothetical protein
MNEKAGKGPKEKERSFNAMGIPLRNGSALTSRSIRKSMKLAIA